jgi:hypothetical protein
MERKGKGRREKGKRIVEQIDPEEASATLFPFYGLKF